MSPSIRRNASSISGTKVLGTKYRVTGERREGGLLTDVEVTGADLVLAADAAESAALLVGRGDAASCTRALAAALPGSASSVAAAQLATTWAARERTLSAELSGYADGLRATAATYGQADGLSASRIEVSGGLTR